MTDTNDEAKRTAPLAFWRYAHDYLRAFPDQVAVVLIGYVLLAAGLIPPRGDADSEAGIWNANSWNTGTNTCNAYSCNTDTGDPDTSTCGGGTGH